MSPSSFSLAGQNSLRTLGGGDEIMEALAIAGGSVACRIQSSCLKKQLKPTRVCFSNFGSFPNSRLLFGSSSSSQKPIVPVLVTASSYDDLAGQHSNVLKNLSPTVRKRVEVLKGIHNQCEEMKAKFVEERSALEAKYLKLYEPLSTKRCEIVSGEEVGGGVPDFWLTVLKNNEITGKDITERDEGALKYLKNIKWSILEESRGFKLEFFFDQNPYFKNTVLTKEYYVADEYFWPSHWKTDGTRIEWYPGNSLDPKNATNTKDFENFFFFFSPARYGNWVGATSDEESGVTRYDYRIGLTIKLKIISHAVSWFTAQRVVLENLSPTVGKCVEVLREIEKQYDELEAKYLEEMASLEAKYHKLYQPLYTKRYETVNGVVEVEGAPEQGDDKSAEEKGVPDFWLLALKRSAWYFNDEIYERDEGALKYLKDIRWSRIEEASNWFKIEFFFDQNPYFKNTVLTKTYHIIDGSFYYNDVDKSIGTEIEWYPGNCLTVKPTRTTEETEEEEDRESFFDLFSTPPNYNLDKDQMWLRHVFAFSYRHEIISHVVSLFLGDVEAYEDSISDESDSISDESDWEEYQGEDYDDDDDYWEEIFSKSTPISSEATGL